MTEKDENVAWENATWEGARRAQLRRSLQLTPRQRFEALETMAETGHWLAAAGESLAEQRREKDDVPAVVEESGVGYTTGNDEQPAQ